MKMDKIECEYSEQRDLILESMKICKGSKKNAKKFIENQRQRNQFGERIQFFGASASLDQSLEYFLAHGILMFLR